jgi:hypothetical protein
MRTYVTPVVGWVALCGVILTLTGIALRYLRLG